MLPNYYCTFNNVAYFQIVNNLDVTGWVDTNTYNKLVNATEYEETTIEEIEEKPVAIITNVSSNGYGKNQTVTFEAIGNEATEKIFIGLYNGNNYANYTTIEGNNGKYEVKITEEGTYTIFAIAYGEDGSQTKGYEMQFVVSDKSNGLTVPAYFALGVGEELLSVVKGTADFLLDIPGGLESMAEGIKFLWRARTPGTEESELFQEMIAAIIDEFNTGTTNEQARMAGRATVQVVLTVLVVKGAAKGVQTLVTKVKDGTFINSIANVGTNVKDSAKKIASTIVEIKKSDANAFTTLMNYIKANGKLPENYLTKSEARALGWKQKKGNLADIAPGKSIGGDIYHNDKGWLPSKQGRIWYEADVNYVSGYRGTERLMYSSDGLFYKTIDHGETFTKIGG